MTVFWMQWIEIEGHCSCNWTTLNAGLASPCLLLPGYEVTYIVEGRKQAVRINSESSDPWKLLIGVPQGSMLRPIPFTIYTLSVTDIVMLYFIIMRLIPRSTCPVAWMTCSQRWAEWKVV